MVDAKNTLVKVRHASPWKERPQATVDCAYKSFRAGLTRVTFADNGNKRLVPMQFISPRESVKAPLQACSNCDVGRASSAKLDLHAGSTKFNTHNEKGRQCTRKITLRRVRVTPVAVEKQSVFHILSVCVCVCVCVWPELSTMQGASAVLYFHLWPVWLYHIFPRYLIKGTIFGKKLLNIKCVFWLSLEKFLTLTRIQRDITILVRGSSCKLPVILARF
jgi:hypothetical protein